MKGSTFYLFLSAIALAICAGLFASTDPDGLEKVIKVLKIERRSGYSAAPFAHYIIGAIKHPSFSTALAGIIGVLLIIFIFHSILHLRHMTALLMRLMKAERKDNDVE